MSFPVSYLFSCLFIVIIESLLLLSQYNLEMGSLSDIQLSDVLFPIYTLSSHSLHGVLYSAKGLLLFFVNLDEVWFISFYFFCRLDCVCCVQELFSRSYISVFHDFLNHFVIVNSLIKSPHGKIIEATYSPSPQLYALREPLCRENGHSEHFRYQLYVYRS